MAADRRGINPILLIQSKSFILSLAFIFFSIFLIVSVYSESVYPWSSLFAITFCSLVLAFAAFNNTYSIVHLSIMIILGAILHRTILLFYPSTLISYDPDKWAASVNLIMDSGSLDIISQWYFYSEAPLFHVFTAEVGLILGLSGQESIFVHSLLPLIILPLVGCAVLSNYDIHAATAGILLSVFGGGMISQSIIPRPSLHSVLFLAVIILLAYKFEHSRNNRYLVLLVVLIAVSVFTHKLPGLLIAFIFLSTILVCVSRWIIIKSPKRLKYTKYLSIIFIITVSLTLVQWVILNLFFVSVFRNTVLSLMDPDPLQGVEPAYELARASNPGVSGIVTRNIHWMVATPIAGLAWAVCWYRGVSSTILGYTAAVYGLFTLTLLAPVSASPARFLSFAELSAALVISLGLFKAKANSTGNIYKMLVCFGVLILLVTQLAGAAAAPDHPNEIRSYLTEGEKEGKLFAGEYSSSEVYSDTYFARQNVYYGTEGDRDGVSWHPSSDPTPEGHTEFTSELFNADFDPTIHQYILLRPKVKNYAADGTFQLVYNPDRYLRQDTQFNRVYSNSESNLFKSRGE